MSDANNPYHSRGRTSPSSDEPSNDADSFHTIDIHMADNSSPLSDAQLPHHDQFFAGRTYANLVSLRLSGVSPSLLPTALTLSDVCSDDENICAICLEDLVSVELASEPNSVALHSYRSTNPTNPIRTPCGHAFHLSCLQRSFEMSGQTGCPICRTQLFRLTPSGREQWVRAAVQIGSVGAVATALGAGVGAVLRATAGHDGDDGADAA
ncbi:hypothetical protein K402DRAFT_232987 [Aulographum hederae CBS 113979]|uniref:RING-type domain-containing protein n=1 Tax=Aulographum hederae CBS 113979 TaxID=1176131 RepID=A0A6G1GL01_9PEZI|nr:hypothetical protein K402DRAFT_232987 [Aulographum hederae CBS 113979]